MMPDTIPDLWPAEIAVDVQSPAAILRRQASQLRIRTKGALEAELVTQTSDKGKVTYDFRIIAAALDGYTYSLFTAAHDKNLVYPVKIWFKPWVEAAKNPGSRTIGSLLAEAVFPNVGPDPAINGAREATTPDELIDLLKGVLSSPDAVGVIMSLLARINETASAETPVPPTSHAQS